MDASQHGDENVNFEVNEEDVQSSTPSDRSPSHQPEDSEDNNEELTYERRTKGGLTKPYRLKRSFHESGMTSQTLSEIGLDFFNLTELGRLLRYDKTVILRFRALLLFSVCIG
jgi:hypothetical protein